MGLSRGFLLSLALLSPRLAAGAVVVLPQASFSTTAGRASGVFDGHALDGGLRGVLERSLPEISDEAPREWLLGVIAEEPSVQEAAVERIALSADPSAAARRYHYDFFETLRRHGQKPMDVEARAAQVTFLLQRYAGWLTRLNGRASLPEPVRLEAAAIRGRFVGNHSAASLLALSRQAIGTAKEAEQALQRRGFADVGKSLVDPAWNPSEPEALPEPKAQGETAQFVMDVHALELQLKDAWKIFESAAWRHERAVQLGMSQKNQAATEQAAREKAERLKEALDSAVKYADYAVGAIYPFIFSFYPLDQDAAWSLHPGLKLVETPKGYRILAAFATAIDRADVIETFRHSIERYWRGAFTRDGRRVEVETAVDVLILRPDQESPQDRLLLKDGKSHSSATPDGIALERRFDFAVPAHEFGHVLGLPDEYRTVFEEERVSIRSENPESSLMGSLVGLVQPRHLEKALDHLMLHRP